MSDGSLAYKPSRMAKGTWDYLLEFTLRHEGFVSHMYHNFPKVAKFPDVSCGIGFLLPANEKISSTPSALTVKEWLPHFVSIEGKNVSEADFIKDWEDAFKVKRIGEPKGGEINEFVNSKDCKLKLRIKSEIVKPKMAQIMAKKLNEELNNPPVKDCNFWALPAVAQIAIASCSYGFSPMRMKNFGTAITKQDFEAAAREIQLSSMSPGKNYDHKLLMLDADYIYKYVRDDEVAMSYIPPRFSKWALIANQSGAVGLGGTSEQIMSE